MNSNRSVWYIYFQVGEEVEVALNQYKKDIEEVNRKTAENANEPEDSAKNIMSAVSSLPELTERKKKIDKHTNIATSLLEQIKKRSLDAYVSMEEDIMTTPSAGSKGMYKTLMGYVCLSLGNVR